MPSTIGMHPFSQGSLRWASTSESTAGRQALWPGVPKPPHTSAHPAERRELFHARVHFARRRDVDLIARRYSLTRKKGHTRAKAGAAKPPVYRPST